MFIATMNIVVGVVTVAVVGYCGYILFKDHGKYYTDTDGTVKPLRPSR